MPVTAVAVVSKWNTPLYLKVYGAVDSEEEFRLTCLLQSSLDIVEEKLTAHPASDLYLGFLMSMEEHQSYGCTGNTRVKLLVTFTGDVPEAHLKRLFQRLNEYVVAATCNPFYPLDTPIQSPEFAAKVEALVTGKAGG